MQSKGIHVHRAVLVACILVVFGSIVQAAPEAPGKRTNLVSGLPYWISFAPDSSYPDAGGELTDGVKGSASLRDPAWQGHLRNQFRVVTFDLGSVKPIDYVTVGVLYDPNAGINLPDYVAVYTSVNGREWSSPRTVRPASLGVPTGVSRQEYPIRSLEPMARYVRVVLSVYIWTFVDEIEVWGEDRAVAVDEPTDLLDMSDPLLGLDTAALDAGLRLHVAPGHNVGAYAQAGSGAAGGARHIVLIYTHKVWETADALPYVAYGRREERNVLAPITWEDWFFDAFLFLALRDPNGLAFDSPARGVQAGWESWRWFLDFLFTPDQQLSAFDNAVALAKQSIDDPGYKVKVFIMIPNPRMETEDFGDPTGLGRTLDFSPFPARWEEALQDRTAAVEAYLDELLARWEAHQFEHLELVGLYWLGESMQGPADYELVRRVTALVHERDLKLLWIPYFGAGGWSNWQAIGFDAAVYQPNYMFDASVPRDRFRQVAEAAKRYGMGIEIEANESVLSTELGRRRYYDYLDAGVQYGFIDTALHAYYQGVDILGQAFASGNDAVRAVYDATYRYVKGIYVPGAR